MNVAIDIAAFAGCSALITFSGTKLSRQGNAIAQITGLSKAWIGLILMATVTSLPELVTGISAVTVVKAPDLAVGNVLGSCAFNLLMLSFLDLFLKKPITSQVTTSHIVTGAFSIILLAIAGAVMSFTTGLADVGGLSPYSIAFAVVYLLAIRSIFRYEKIHPAPAVNTHPVANASALRNALAIYFAHALVVVSASLFLPYFGERIASTFNLTQTLFGTIFLAIATSLPEVVVSVSAVRMGALDLAMGNLLGSNIFNIALLAPFDFFYPAGNFFAAMSHKHIISVYACIVMTAIVAIGLVVRQENKRWHLSIDSWLIVIIYLLTLLML